MTKKKRDRRNLKKLQENLTEVFSASSFSDSAIEEKDDNFGKVADESNEKNYVVEGVRSKQTKQLMSWELAGTNQMDIRYRNNEEIENDKGKQCIGDFNQSTID